jgi:hypothetical protein
LSPGDSLSFRKTGITEAETELRSMAENLSSIRAMTADWRSRRGRERGLKREGRMNLRLEGQNFDVSWKILK